MQPSQGIASREDLVAALVDFQVQAAASAGSTVAVKPSHRVPFHWPPHPISSDYHILASDWTGESTLSTDGETFAVKVARTPHGIFGKVDQLWVDARGDSEQEMLRALELASKPLFERQWAISKTLGLARRFDGHVRELAPLELLKLLYCVDRDVAHDAQVEIESHASTKIFGPALIAILLDACHPQRRSAQWCVLDMFEDLPSFFDGNDDELRAIEAIRGLIWRADDDYARTIYKAGVVLGGHVCTEASAAALISCIEAPSKIGRRSAIHAVFHLAEWMPSKREAILAALNKAGESDPEPSLQTFARSIARDIEANETEHMMEPLFPDEP